MKILHINSADKTGGAAIAAFRHSQALNSAGIESAMLVVNKSSNDPMVLRPEHSGKFTSVKSHISAFLHSKYMSLYSPYATWSYPLTGFDLSKEKCVREADVIFLHWVPVLTIRQIEAILRLGKPTYWFLHDMWPFTGGCHYSFDCTKYLDSCSDCNLLKNKKGLFKKDIARKLFLKKTKHILPYKNLEVLAPSQWLADCAAASTIFKNHRVRVCRNVIDTDVFKPLSKELCRKALNLPQGKKLLLFGADDVSSPYKGWNYLRGALDSMKEENVECVVFGNKSLNDDALQSDIKIHYVGRLSDEYSLALLYNACDYFVTSSIADNFPNVILEAMACGLICVGFNIGGIPEMIQDGVTGFISNEISVEGLGAAIHRAMIHENLSAFADNARKWVLENASFRIAEKQISQIINA